MRQRHSYVDTSTRHSSSRPEKRRCRSNTFHQSDVGSTLLKNADSVHICSRFALLPVALLSLILGCQMDAPARRSFARTFTSVSSTRTLTASQDVYSEQDSIPSEDAPSPSAPLASTPQFNSPEHPIPPVTMGGDPDVSEQPQGVAEPAVTALPVMSNETGNLPAETPLPATRKEAIVYLKEVGARVASDYDDNLREIDLAYIPFSDRQAEVLTLFDDVTEIDLTGTQVSDTALRSIRRLRNLESLKLKGTNITDDAVSDIAEFEELKVLDLGRTAVSDASMGQLKRLKKLQYLLLNHTQVTDACIVHLQALENLKGINLIGASISAEGLQRLEKQLPKCLVVFQSDNEISHIQIPAEFSLAARGSQASAEDRAMQLKLRRLRELAFQDPELAEQVAAVLTQRGDWERAVVILEVAAEVRSSDRNLQCTLAKALAHVGRTEEACSLLTKFMGESAAHYTVAVISYEAAMTQSERLLQQSIASDSQNRTASDLLVQIQRQRPIVTQNHPPQPHIAPVSMPTIIPRNDRYVIPARTTSFHQSASRAGTISRLAD